jgi:WD40 repeat protein
VRQLAVGVYDFSALSILSPDAKLVAVRRGEGPFPETGQVNSRIEWMRSSGELLHSVASAPRTFGDMAFSPDAGTLATSGATDVESRSGNYRRRIEIVLWDVDSGKERQQATVTDAHLRDYHHGGTKLTYSPDGQFIASDGPDWSVQLWNADTLEPQTRLEGLRSHLTAVQFSPDGRVVVGVSGKFEGPICIWSRESGQVLWKYDQPGFNWEGASFSPDGNWLVTKATDKKSRKSSNLVQIWDVHHLLGVGGDESGLLQ